MVRLAFLLTSRARRADLTSEGARAVGGNNAITTMGISDSAVNVTEGQGAYDDYSGGRATRVITPCEDETCEYGFGRFGEWGGSEKC